MFLELVECANCKVNFLIVVISYYLNSIAIGPTVYIFRTKASAFVMLFTVQQCTWHSPFSQALQQTYSANDSLIPSKHPSSGVVINKIFIHTASCRRIPRFVQGVRNSVFVHKLCIFGKSWSYKHFFIIININNVRDNLTDIIAKIKTLGLN